MSYTAHLQLSECSWREQPQQPEFPAWHNTARCQGLVLTAHQCNTSSDRNTLVLAVSSWLRTALSSIIQDTITFLPICLGIMSRELYKLVKFLFLNFTLPVSGNTHKGKMDRQEVPVAAWPAAWALAGPGEDPAQEWGSCRASGQAGCWENIWRKRHPSTAQKLTFKNKSQVFHIKNCKLQLKIKEDRKLVKIHFGKQWRQLEKCIIQCQETAQGSKPEPQPGTDWSVSIISLWKWAGEEAARSTFLQTATIFHCTKDSGDIYFQNYSWTLFTEHLSLHRFWNAEGLGAWTASFNMLLDPEEDTALS